MKTKTTVPYLKKWKFLLFNIPFILCSLTSIAQTQVGADIDGEAVGDHSGYLSMPDAYTVAIGANNNDGNGMSAGHVRIYKWNGTNWVQKGSDIDGEVAGDQSGLVSMPDSSTVAIGAFSNDVKGRYTGHVRIYRWNGNNWVQKGIDIDGEAAGDYSGYSISMPDSNTVAIGAPYNDGNVNNSRVGHVRIYYWNGSNWTQKGGDIDGETSGDESGSAVYMPDNRTVAIGAYKNNDNGPYAGHVRVYYWNGSNWLQKGGDIDGEFADDRSGRSVCMSDSNTLAIGAIKNDGNGSESGHVRVYRWSGVNWIQKGADIDGDTALDKSGRSVSMPDSNVLAIGAPHNSDNGTSAGHVKVYRWNSNSWVQIGRDIDGEALDDRSGWSISMPDEYTLSIGALYNDGNGVDAGHVRVYSLCNGAVDTSVTFSANTFVSNDTSATYQWVNCDSAYAPVIGATNRSFIPSNTGNYSVIVTRSHCVDTSACYNVVVGLREYKAKEEQFTVYPNPSNETFTIESRTGNNNTAFEILDVRGKIVRKGKLMGKQTSLDLSGYSSGIYLLRVSGENIKLILK